MTAEDFLEDYLHKNAVPWHPDLDRIYGQINIAMIQFAEYHVEQALKQASIKVSTRDIQDSILNAYPLENIK